MSRNLHAPAICLVLAAAFVAVPGGAGAQARQPRGAAGAALPAVKSITANTRTTKAIKAGTVTGGQELVLRVELTAPAPCVERCGGKTVNGAASGYMRVMLSADNATQFPATQVFVNTGQTTGEANVVTKPVTVETAFNVSAMTDGTAPQTVRITVVPPVLTSFAIAQSDVVSGQVVKGVAHFSGPPASPTAVKFQVQTTNGQAVKVPATVTLEPNKTAAEFDIQTLGVPQDRNAHVVAMYLDKTLPAPLTVRAAVLTSMENENPCCTNPFRISLNGAPPPQGAAIQLTSANPARIVVPPSLTIQPGQTSVLHYYQSIPGNSDEQVRITASYNGVSKHYSVVSRKIVKPDLVLRDVTFYDSFGNVITTIGDGQPIKLCATVRAHREGELPPNVDAPPSILRIEYSTSTGTGTSAGRTTDFPTAFVRDVNQQYPPITHCTNLAGISQGNHIDVTLVADYRQEVDESRESNNTEKVKIARPSPND